MGTKVNLEYQKWNKRDDIMPEFPVSELGVAAVQSGLVVGHYLTKREEERDSLIGPTVQGVVQLLAASLEWLRQHGLGAGEVEQKVHAYLMEARATPQQRVRRAVHEAEGISDAMIPKERLDQSKVVNIDGY